MRRISLSQEFSQFDPFHNLCRCAGKKKVLQTGVKFPSGLSQFTGRGAEDLELGGAILIFLERSMMFLQREFGARPATRDNPAMTGQHVRLRSSRRN
jgi:hypothetical protein